MMIRQPAGRVSYVDIGTDHEDAEKGYEIACKFDENYFAAHPEATQFVRHRIPGEFRAYERIQDPKLRSQMLTALMEADATLVTRNGDLIERELACITQDVEVATV